MCVFYNRFRRGHIDFAYVMIVSAGDVCVCVCVNTNVLCMYIYIGTFFQRGCSAGTDWMESECTRL